MLFGEFVVNRPQRVIRPQPFFSIRCKPGITQSCKVPGRFGLRNLQHFHKVANAKLPVMEEQQEHLKPGFIGKNFEESSGFFQSNLLCLHSYNRINECSQELFPEVPQVQLTQYLLFSQGQQGGGPFVFHFHVILNLSINISVQLRNRTGWMDKLFRIRRGEYP